MKKIKIVDDRFKGFLEVLPDSIVIVNNDGKIQFVNSQTEKLFGYKREEMIGKEVELLMPSHHRNAHHGHRNNYWNNPIPRPMGAPGRDLFARHKDGKEFPVAISLNKLETEEGLFVLAAIRDVTYQKLIEKELREAKESAEKTRRIAEEAVKAKQQFLSKMSHEIRTPMNAIIGFTKVVLRTNLNKNQKEYLNAIKISGDALIILINDILDLAKVNEGKMVFEQTPFNLLESINSTLHLFEENIQEKNLELIRQYAPAIPENVMGDQVHLRQIILNLMSNALKFTKEGKITLSLGILKEDAEKISIKFAITDTGIGIPKSQQKHIYDAFQQVSSETSKLYGGTGLGLAIVKEFVERQGGTLNLNSEVGKGSTFGFVLSFKKLKAKKINIKEEVFSQEISVKKINILVVEDNKLNQLLMKTLLEEFGFRLDIAINGKIALEYLQKNKYDLILMDLHMPLMNGFEATVYIRKKMKSKVPIIALTADVTSSDIKKCKAAGMNDYISKPVDDKLLYNKIIKLMKI